MKKTPLSLRIQSAVILVCFTFTQALPVRADQQPGCYNTYTPTSECSQCKGGGDTSAQDSYGSLLSPSSPGGGDAEPGDNNHDGDCGVGGANPADLGMSDAQRKIVDLEVFGGVGGSRLAWSRTGHTRLIVGGRYFGDGHGWRHSYQWELVSTGTGKLRLVDPSGNTTNFTLSAGVWTTLPSIRDLLTQSGTNYYLRRTDGIVYHFQQLTSGGQTYYQLQDFKDRNGLTYLFTYDTNRNLAMVKEPAGRWLRISYQPIAVNQSAYTTLATVAASPGAGLWGELPVTNTTAFRYLRFYSTDPDQPETFCNVAEVEFYDTAGAKLSGTAFGTSPSYQNNPTRTFDKATDGNPATYFDFAYRHFGFTGIDLGAGNAKQIGKVRYLGRPGFEGRLVKARFEGSNSAPVTETVIAKVEAGYGTGATEVVTRTVNYNYATQADPVVATSWLVLSSASYGDGTAAAYTYNSAWAGQRPLLQTADDPRIAGAATRIKYVFWADSYVYGGIYQEADPVTGVVLAKFEGVGANNYTNTGRKVTYATGQTKLLTFGPDHTVTAITDGAGATSIATYGPNGNGFLASITDAAGRTTSFTRNANGRPLGITNPDGTTRSMTRNANGWLMSRTDELGRTTTYTRNAQDRVTRTDYPDGTFETWAYNAAGQTTSHRSRDGGTQSSGYDARGLLTSTTNALGQTTAYAYNANDLVSSVTDPLGRVTAFEYNERGQVTKTTFPDGKFITNAYDAYGNLIATMDELGQVSGAAFDSFKRRISQTDALGRTTTFAYDEPTTGGGGCCGGAAGGMDQLTTMTLPSGRKLRYFYDGEGRRTAEIKGYGTTQAAVTQYTYDLAGNLSSVVDPDGFVTSYSYDSMNRRSAQTDPLGRVTQWTYDAAGRTLSVTSAAGTASAATVTYTYDARDRVATMTDPTGLVTSHSYGLNATGETESITAPLNRITASQRDLLGRTVSVTLPDGSTRSTAYDAAGRTVSGTDESGAVTTFGYDARDRRVSVTDPLNRTTTFAYDAAGRQVLITSPAGRTVSTAYDAAGQVTSTTQAAGTSDAATSSVTYDADGRVLTQTDANGSVTTFAYNSRGDRTSVTDGLGNVQSVAYNARGLATTVTNPDGTTTLTGYDGAGQRVSQRDERGFVRTYGYTARGQLASLTDARNSVTGWSYDAAGRLLRKTYADATHVDYAYDGAGRLATRTWARGVVTTYAYDVRDRVTGISYSDGTPAVAMSYDADGRVTSVSNGVSGTGYTYDAAGQMTLETQSVAGHPLVVRNLTSSYDADGLRTGLVYPSGKVLAAGYTARGQLAGLTFHGQAVAMQTWRANGQPLATTYGNGAQRAQSYDAANRLTATGTSVGGTNVTARGYILDSMGRRTGYVDESSANATFSYDLSSQVTSGTVPVPGAAASASTYAYDAEGNRTQSSIGYQPVQSVTYQTNALNQYMQINAQAPAYDADGNTLSAFRVPSSTFNYVWDGENRLTSAAPAAPANGDRGLVLSYDALGRRVRKSMSQWNGSAWVALEDRYFTYDGWNVIEESITPAGGTTQTAESVWGTDLSGSAQGAGGVGGLLLREVSAIGATPASASYYHYDGNGNVTALTDATGTVQAAYTYGPFGELLAATGLQALANPWRFSTKYQDDETGLLYYGYRYYDAGNGRWINRDPIGEIGGLNQYGMVSNNPVDRRDYLGLDDAGPLGGLLMIDASCKDAKGEAKSILDNITFISENDSGTLRRIPPAGSAVNVDAVYFPGQAIKIPNLHKFFIRCLCVEGKWVLQTRMEHAPDFIRRGHKPVLWKPGQPQPPDWPGNFPPYKESPPENTPPWNTAPVPRVPAILPSPLVPPYGK